MVCFLLVCCCDGWIAGPHRLSEMHRKLAVRRTSHGRVYGCLLAPFFVMAYRQPI